MLCDNNVQMPEFLSMALAIEAYTSIAFLVYSFIYGNNIMSLNAIADEKREQNCVGGIMLPISMGN